MTNKQMNKTTEVFESENSNYSSTSVERALKLAEEAMTSNMRLLSAKALAAIREALAEQAEQEPVGYFAYDEEHDIWEELTGPNAPGATKLYAAPVSIALQSETDSSSSSMRTTVRTIDLTDYEAQKLWNDTSSIVPMWAHHLHFARAVIAADREKNK